MEYMLFAAYVAQGIGAIMILVGAYWMYKSLKK